jgi:membrane protease YdiL (CAAX protease family)
MSRMAERSRVRIIDRVDAPVWLACAFATYLAMAVGASLAMPALPPAPAPGPPAPDSTGSIERLAMLSLASFGLASMVGVVIVYALAPRLDPADRAGLRVRWRDVPVGLGLLAALAPVWLLVNMLSVWVSTEVFNVPVPKNAHVALEAFVRAPASMWAIVFAIGAVTLTPLTEELIYRGFLQSAIARLVPATHAPRAHASRERGASRFAHLRAVARLRLPAILITSLLFAVMHAIGGGPVPWAAVPGLIVLAAALGLAFEHTRSLGVPIVMHAGFNAANLGLALL